jgi:UDP-3-O-[3-hydroxymyristoyl] N-acetylglucosamine deacetylase
VTRQVIVEGVGLHTGAPARVMLQARPGPVRIRAGGLEALVEELTVASTERATTVAAHEGRLRIATVEHLFAALAGLGVYQGLIIAVDGPEVPLLDGGASTWCEAVTRLALLSGAPRLRVTRQAVICAGTSRYEFSPGPGVEVEACLELDDARLSTHASWRGDAGDFVARVAPARTFAFARDVDELTGRGLVRHVDPESVVLIAPDAIHHAGRTFSRDEPVLHKLLDLVGDLYLHGGPPLGRVSAVRPGHAANARAIQAARSDGVLVPS